MKEVNNATALVYDNGLFLPLARRLAKDFKRVLYFTPWARGFTKLSDCVYGDGFPDVERCDDIWKVKSEVDLFVFPDIHNSGIQQELVSQNLPVWGSKSGDSIEWNREKLMRMLGELGLNVPEFEVVVGITALRVRLRDAVNKFIKISRFRGSFETTHWVSWEQNAGDLDVWAVEFGACRELIRFLVFDPIGDELEIGADTYCVNGEWPSRMLRGDEFKDKSYIGAVTNKSDMPEQILEVMAAFSPWLAKVGYANQWSMEMRGEGDKWYFIDATCRGGLPSTASQLNLMSNFSEVVWAGAHGELLQPEYSHDFSAECALSMKGEKGAWRKFVVEEKLQEAMKLAACCEVDGAVCFPPDECHDEEIGWLQASGDSIEEAVMKLGGFASKLPDGVSANTDTLVDLLKTLHKADEAGVGLTDEKLPEPEIAIKDA